MRTQSSTCLTSFPQSQRQALLLELLPVFQRIAAHLASTYRWAAPRVESDDLAQIGALAVLEALHKGLRTTGDPTGYLVVIGRRAMQLHCGVYASLIASPRKANGYQPSLPVVSLDAPLSDGSGLALFDLLADEAAQDDYNVAYDAYLDTLPV